MTYANNIMSDGEQLLPQIIDEKAKAGYSRPYAMYPRSLDLNDGFHSISFSRISNAINRACWWLESNMPDEDERQNHFAYLGSNDLRYVILLMATMKTGRKVLIPSTRNTPEAQISLFEKVNCKVLVTCSSLSQILNPLFALATQVRKVEAPSLDELLAEELVPYYDFNERLEAVAKKIIFTAHTSGSSGNPKPITMNHTYMKTLSRKHDLPEDQGLSLTKQMVEHQKLLLLFPCFHIGGLCFSTYPICFETTLVLGHPSVPMSPQYVSQLLRQSIATSLLTPPTFLETLSRDPFALQDLAKLNHIGYVGGPLRPDVREKFAPIVPHIFSFIGTTENGPFHCVSGSNENSDSIRFYTDIGYRFDEISECEFELVIVSNERTNHYHGIFETFPSVQEYRTRDIYSPKTGAPGWWTFRGRADDLIILSNGEKINPISMENIVFSNPAVKAALVVGDYRFNPSLLVELVAAPPQTEAEKLDILNLVWPTVQEANKIAPGFAKIPKSLILFASANKPFLRAGKGTVQRQLTVESYAAELDRLSSSQQEGLLTEGLTIRRPASLKDIDIFIRQIYSQALDIDYLNDSDDVFQRGMDSLRVTVIAQRLRAALNASGIRLNPTHVNNRLVYSFPSIAKIAEALKELIIYHGSGRDRHGKSGRPSRGRNLEAILERYSQDINPAKELAVPVSSGVTESWHVILTGTTGSLGSYLLAALEAMPDSKVSKIYCLNRSVDGKERQRKASSSRGLSSSWPDCEEQRVEFIQADLAMPDLGLRPKMYSKLLQETTIVIHCAWQVDFNLTVESFEPQIQGLRNLLDFSATTASNAPLIFISTISTAMGWLDKHPNEKVPERIIHDFDAPESLGYSESKFVSELLVERFSKAAGLTTAVFRTGQIAGPIKGSGSWNNKEWFPSIIASSKYLGVLPDNFGKLEAIDWIPVDVLSSIMIELVESLLQKDKEGNGQTLVYNLVNPKVTAWSSLSKAVQKLAGISRLVSLKEWVKELQDSCQERNGTIVESNPAVKLLDYFSALSEKERQFDGAARYEVKGLLHDSQQASQLPEVSASLIKLWIEQWGF